MMAALLSPKHVAAITGATVLLYFFHYVIVRSVHCCSTGLRVFIVFFCILFVFKKIYSP